MSDSLEAFDSTLKAVLKKKPPISASTTSELTKTAASQPLENVPKLVAKIENFISSSPSSYKLSGFYLIDSICKTKSEVRKAYIENFAARLASHVAAFLADASIKDEDSIKKLARIWLEKHIFTDSTMSQVAQVLKDKLQYTIPGSESLPPPTVPIIATSSVHLPPAHPSPSGQMWPYPPQYPPPTSQIPPVHGSNYPHGASQIPFLPTPIPYQPPASLGSTGSLTDDLNKLGDLSALLGAPITSMPPRRDSDFPPHPPMDSRYPPNGPTYPLNDGRMPADPRMAVDNRLPMMDSRYDRDQHQPNAYAPPQQPYRDPRQNGNPRDRPDFQGRPVQHAPRQGQAPREGFATPGEESGPVYSSTLFVGSLPHASTEQDMHHMFAPFGKIKRVTMKADRGIAFIAYFQRSDAEMAKSSQDGAKFGDRNIKIRWAKSDQHYHGTVDPETGLMSFGDDAASASSNQASSSSQPPIQRGIPKGVKPQVGSSFADDGPAPAYNNAYSQRGVQDPRTAHGGDANRDDGYRGKRPYEGDQPAGEKRRFTANSDTQGFQSVTSWSGS